MSCPVSLAADNEDVFWNDTPCGSSCPAAGGRILRAQRGGHPVVVAAGLAPTFALAIDSTDVYWSECSSIRRCSRDNCNNSPLTIITNTSAWALAVDANTIYWIDADTGNPSSCPKIGCPASTVLGAAPEKAFQSFAIDSDTVYWASYHTIYSCPKTGCVGPPKVMASNQELSAIAVDDSHLYWTSKYTLTSCEKDKCPTTVRSIAPAASGAVLTVLSPNIYWFGTTNTDTTSVGLVTCSTDNCTNPVLLLQLQLRDPTALVVTSDMLFWLDNERVLSSPLPQQ